MNSNEVYYPALKQAVLMAFTPNFLLAYHLWLALTHHSIL